MKNIKCLNCLELASTFIQLDMNPLESIVSYVNELQQYLEKFDEEKLYQYRHLRCSACKEEILFGDFYITEDNEEEFVKELGSMLGREISNYIYYCSECGFVKDAFEINKTSMIKSEKINSEGMSVEEFLIAHYVPPHFTKFIIPFLKCGCCGYGFDGDSKTYNFGSFNNSHRVYSQDDIIEILEIDMNDWEIFAEKYDIFLRKVELTNFLSYIKKNPILAYKHFVGLKLYNLFESMFNRKDYIILDEGFKLFRGRTRIKGNKKFESLDMWEPPFGVSSHGRYNLVGTLVLYLTDNKKFVPYEVSYKKDEELDIATIEVKKPLKVLDLSNLLGDFGRYLFQSPQNGNVLKLEYLLTNYISACSSEIGFNGVKYKGVREGNYYNYAILNYQRDEDLSIFQVDTTRIRILYKIVND